jgi:hypothetical protein
MAVPSSGTLRLASIRNEIENNVYEATYTASATSLASASNGTYGSINTYNSSANRPDGSTPHAMSEFYAYDHDYNPVDYSATLTTGVTTYLGSVFSGYRTGFPTTNGTLSNTSFNGYTIANFSHLDGSSGTDYIEITFTSGRPSSFTDITINSTSYGGSSGSWYTAGSNSWRYNTSTNPFGSANTINSITAQY